MVPPTPDGLPRCHEAGKPILPPDMEHLASGPMLPLQHCIQYQESVLLKEKDPNYPVFSVKVPSDQHFVNEDPADIFFIAFEDVFNLFHSKRLDYNLLQDGSSTRTKAVRYLESFMLMNKEKNTILLPVFPEDKYCTLIILCPKWSLAQYFDSSNTTTKKDYRRIRGVLDEAILGYSKNGGTFDKKGEFVRPDTKKLGFKHVIDFPCIKQLAALRRPSMSSITLKEMTYYVVFEGRVPGVYEEWEECKKQVHKFSGNCYKGYPTRHEAVAKWRAHQAKKSKMKTFLVLSLLLTIVAAVLYFILVYGPGGTCLGIVAMQVSRWSCACVYWAWQQCPCQCLARWLAADGVGRGDVLMHATVTVQSGGGSDSEGQTRQDSRSEPESTAWANHKTEGKASGLPLHVSAADVGRATSVEGLSAAAEGGSLVSNSCGVVQKIRQGMTENWAPSAVHHDAMINNDWQVGVSPGGSSVPGSGTLSGHAKNCKDGIVDEVRMVETNEHEFAGRVGMGIASSSQTTEAHCWGTVEYQVGYPA
ncbi:hypothetical protein QYE76_009702 [Lolium multiflorum]|uniref:Ribonuclease H1 N-terminal domain-containing protein n=1 Tax=Lolium multiflorum TaxID=4521 RepID=A0AAD8X2C0_LOLMU|nr:hypothetical protein QYE76_009702 [Lolium multiflorum]